MEEEVSLQELWKMLKNHFGMIILWPLFGLLLTGIYSFFLINPEYSANSKIVVNQTQSTNQVLTNADIQTNLNLINTYQSIIKEPIILEEAINRTNSDLGVGELSNQLSIQTSNDSLVFGISVRNENPYLAAELVNAIAQVFEEKVGDILDVQSVTILSQATPNTSPVSPNIPLNLAVGILLGLAIGVGLAVTVEFLDKRVKDERIIDEIGWTNLGAVTEMSAEELKSSRIHGNKQRSILPSIRTRRV